MRSLGKRSGAGGEFGETGIQCAALMQHNEAEWA